MEARRAHNPEVVGSSPASATIKEPGIDTKLVPGLFFICWDISVCFGDIPFIFAQKYSVYYWVHLRNLAHLPETQKCGFHTVYLCLLKGITTLSVYQGSSADAQKKRFDNIY